MKRILKIKFIAIYYITYLAFSLFSISDVEFYRDLFSKDLQKYSINNFKDELVCRESENVQRFSDSLLEHLFQKNRCNFNTFLLSLLFISFFVIFSSIYFYWIHKSLTSVYDAILSHFENLPKLLLHTSLSPPISK